MKILIVVLALLTSGCASTYTPLWQQQLNNLNRQWMTDDPVMIERKQTGFNDVRSQFISVGICKI